MSRAVEITTFKLTRGKTRSDFIAGNVDVDAWLRQQPGFQSRSIAQRADGTIVDTLFWGSVAQAESAMQRLMEELADSPVHGLIDQRTVNWTVAEIFHYVNNQR